MKRTITWTSMSNEFSYLPTSFDFRGGIIMIGNRLPRSNDFFHALMTRTPTVRFTVSTDDVFQFMRQLTARGRVVYDAKQKKPRQVSAKECNVVVTHLQDKGITDLRFLDHAIGLYLRHKRQDRWKALLDVLLTSRSPAQAADEQLVQSLEARSDLTGEQRVKLFKERTGKSRPTYFRVRARLAEHV